MVAAPDDRRKYDRRSDDDIGRQALGVTQRTSRDRRFGLCHVLESSQVAAVRRHLLLKVSGGHAVVLRSHPGEVSGGTVEARRWRVSGASVGG